MQNKLLNSYKEININNYDDDDLRNLRNWADMAYAEIDELQDRLDLANKRLEKINDLAMEA